MKLYFILQIVHSGLVSVVPQYRLKTSRTPISYAYVFGVPVAHVDVYLTRTFPVHFLYGLELCVTRGLPVSTAETLQNVHICCLEP